MTDGSKTDSLPTAYDVVDIPGQGMINHMLHESFSTFTEASAILQDANLAHKNQLIVFVVGVKSYPDSLDLEMELY